MNLPLNQSQPIDLDNLTLGQAKHLVRLFSAETFPQTELVAKEAEPETALQIGQCYFIRTVTYHYTGRLVAITSTELVLEDAAWIADSGRFADALTTGNLDEVEPYPDDVPVIVHRAAVVDACLWTHPLPRVQK